MCKITFRETGLEINLQTGKFQQAVKIRRKK